MIRLIILSSLLLVSRLAYSQTGYPKLIVLGNDTLVAMTVKQAEAVNIVKVQSDRYAELADSLTKDNKNLKVVLTDMQVVMNSMRIERGIQDTLYANANTIIDELNKDLKKVIRRNKWLKIQNAVLYPTVVGLAVTVTVLSLKK